MSMSAIVVTPIRLASLTAMCSLFGPTMTSASGSLIMSRMPIRLRRIFRSSRESVEIIFLECVRMSDVSGARAGSSLPASVMRPPM